MREYFEWKHSDGLKIGVPPLVKKACVAWWFSRGFWNFSGTMRKIFRGFLSHEGTRTSSIYHPFIDVPWKKPSSLRTMYGNHHILRVAFFMQPIEAIHDRLWNLQREIFLQSCLLLATPTFPNFGTQRFCWSENSGYCKSVLLKRGKWWPTYTSDYYSVILSHT